MYHTRKLKCSIIKTHEPTSQFRAENITINSALSGWEGGWSPETHDCYPAGCDCHASFIKKKKKKSFITCACRMKKYSWVLLVSGCYENDGVS